MSLTATLRTSARSGVFTAPSRRIGLRQSGIRRFTTPPPPPPPKSNTALYAGIFAFTAAAAGYYLYTSDSASSREASTAAKSAIQTGKATLKFTPTKEDYQKVRIRHVSSLSNAFTRYITPSLVSWTRPEITTVNLRHDAPVYYSFLSQMVPLVLS